MSSPPIASSATQSGQEAPQKSVAGRIRHWMMRSGQIVAGVLGFYLLCTLIGLIPVNNDFLPAEDGITIYVFSGPVHSDVILPVRTETVHWRDYFPPADFKSPTRTASHVSIGWGDRGFFLETPRWSDLKLSTAAYAILVPSPTLMHVSYSGRPRETTECKSVRISDDQYEKLVNFIVGSFALDEEGRPQRVDFSYHKYDAFYQANGSYHAFNTCNCWVGRALRHSGVRTACFTPLPRSVLLYLPYSDE